MPLDPLVRTSDKCNTCTLLVQLCTPPRASSHHKVAAPQRCASLDKVAKASWRAPRGKINRRVAAAAGGADDDEDEDEDDEDDEDRDARAALPPDPPPPPWGWLALPVSSAGIIRKGPVRIESRGTSFAWRLSHRPLHFCLRQSSGGAV